jgi:hypothetical protein
MNKKLWFTVFALTLAVAAFAQNASDFDIEQLADGTLKITGYKGSARNVVIPSTISGYKVTRIGERAFHVDVTRQIISVVIPDTVVVIEHSAFYNQSTLTSVTLGKGVVEIGYDAFSACYGLKSIEFPPSLRKINFCAFGQVALKSLILPEGLTEIEVRAFDDGYGNNGPEILVIPTSLANSTKWEGDIWGTLLQRVTFPANISDRNLNRIVDAPGLVNFYKSQGKRAGTYVKKGQLWTRE